MNATKLVSKSNARTEGRKMSGRPKLSFSHMGIFVTDINKMVDFYTRVLGLVVSDRDLMKDGREIAFMTADLAYNMIQQLSFRAPDLATLRETYKALKREPIVELGPISHGNAISAYFRDLEGNRFEVSSTRNGTSRSPVPSRSIS
jgi:catechol 2,3-dioxygenase-like lactoylglutathione lyase family enzyme